MVSRVAAVGMAMALAAMAGGPKKPGVGTTGNDDVEIYATVYPQREMIKSLLGADLGAGYMVVDVKITPKYGKEITISHDDFLLRTDKDGDKTTPFEPSQIAGKGVLVVSQKSSGPTTGPMGESGPVYGPPIGGGPMGGPMGGPPMMGAPRGGVAMGGGGSEGAPAVKAGVKDKDDPIIKVLKARILPEKKTNQTVTGLLYFPMDKQKLKDLELLYTTPDGKLSIRFREPK